MATSLDEFDYTNQKDIRGRKLMDIETLLKEEADLSEAAEAIIEGTFVSLDILRKDSLDRFLDFVIFKARTGTPEIISLAYPSMRMNDRELERKIIELINIHLIPEIILRILKYLARNTYDADSNLYLAQLIRSDEIIRPIYETFLLFKKDIWENDPKRRTLNVKRLQQFPAATDNRGSSPLDAAARFKYILEYIAMRKNVDHLYKREDILLSRP